MQKDVHNKLGQVKKDSFLVKMKITPTNLTYPKKC